MMMRYRIPNRNANCGMVKRPGACGEKGLTLTTVLAKTKRKINCWNRGQSENDTHRSKPFPFKLNQNSGNNHHNHDDDDYDHLDRTFGGNQRWPMVDGWWVGEQRKAGSSRYYSMRNARNWSQRLESEISYKTNAKENTFWWWCGGREWDIIKPIIVWWWWITVLAMVLAAFLAVHLIADHHPVV